MYYLLEKNERNSYLYFEPSQSECCISRDRPTSTKHYFKYNCRLSINGKVPLVLKYFRVMVVMRYPFAHLYSVYKEDRCFMYYQGVTIAHWRALQHCNSTYSFPRRLFMFKRQASHRAILNRSIVSCRCHSAKMV